MTGGKQYDLCHHSAMENLISG